MKCVGWGSSRALCREALLVDGSARLPKGTIWDQCFFSANTDIQPGGRGPSCVVSALAMTPLPKADRRQEA